MSISVNIDGIERSVSVVSNNIDGVWRESYNKDKYYIYLYAYGKVYTILTCTKGAKITLPSIPNVDVDDISHYGWTKTEGNTTKDYNPTASLTPTSSMALHAVFKYQIKSGPTSRTYSGTTNDSGSTSAGLTVNITNAEPNSSYTVTKTAMNVYQASESISNPNASGTAYMARWSTGSSSTSSGTASSSGVINFYVSGGSSKSIQIGSKGSSSNGDFDNLEYKTYYSYYIVKVTYSGYTTTTAYRSSLGEYSINLYRYGELYETLTCKKGLPVTLISVPNVQEDDNSHYGWTLTEGSTTRDYASTASFTPTSDTDLHAVFKYLTDVPTSLSRVAETSKTTGAGATISITNAVPDSEYTVSETYYTPHQDSREITTDTSSYTSYYATWSQLGSASTSSGNATSEGVITYNIPGGSAYTIKVGDEGGYVGGDIDTLHDETYYSYYSVRLNYTGYNTYAYRSSV